MNGRVRSLAPFDKLRANELLKEFEDATLAQRSSVLAVHRLKTGS